MSTRSPSARDATTLWSGGDDGAIFAWDLQNATTLVHRASANANVPPLPFDSADMVIAPDGLHVAFPSGDDSHVEIRDVATGRLSPHPIEDGIFLSFSPDGQRFLTVTDDTAAGTLRVWDRGHRRDARRQCREGSGVLELSGWTQGRLHPGRAPRGRNPRRPRTAPNDIVVLDANTLAADGGESVPIGHGGRAVAVTPDGSKAIVVVSDPEQPDTKVLLIDLETRRIVRSTPVELLGEPFQGSRNNTVAPDGRTVGLSNPLGDVGVVDALDGEVTTLLPRSQRSRRKRDVRP